MNPAPGADKAKNATAMALPSGAAGVNDQLPLRTKTQRRVRKFRMSHNSLLEGWAVKLSSFERTMRNAMRAAERLGCSLYVFAVNGGWRIDMRRPEAHWNCVEMFPALRADGAIAQGAEKDVRTGEWSYSPIRLNKAEPESSPVSDSAN